MAISQNPGDTNPMGHVRDASAHEAKSSGRRRGHARDPRPLPREESRTKPRDAGRGADQALSAVGQAAAPPLAVRGGRGTGMRGAGRATRPVGERPSRTEPRVVSREEARGSGRVPSAVRQRIFALRELRPADVADSARSLGNRLLRHRMALVVLAVVVVVSASLYGPLKGYYAARRSGEDLQRKYDELSAKNDSLTSDLKSLVSKEGIEDEARRRGYVQEGETSVTVEGMGGQEKADPSAPVAYQDQRTWPTKALDFFFGYDPEVVWDE